PDGMLLRQRIAFATCGRLRCSGGCKRGACTLDYAPQGGQIGQGSLPLASMRQAGGSLVAFASMPFNLSVDGGEPGGNGGFLPTQLLMYSARLFEPPFCLDSARTCLLTSCRRHPIGGLGCLQGSPGDFGFLARRV